MTQSYEEVQEGTATAAAPVPDPNAQARAHAREDVPRPTSIALDAVTQSGRAARRAITTRAAALDRPGSLLDAQPPTFRQARSWHHQCAGHYDAALIRWPRLAWAYLHLLLIVPVLRAAEWATGSPPRLAVTLAVAVVIWHWS